MYTGAFGSLSGGRSWCTAGAITSASPYVSYPSNIHPSQEAISALQLVLLIEEVQDSPTVTAVICSCRYTTLNKRKVGPGQVVGYSYRIRVNSGLPVINGSVVPPAVSMASTRTNMMTGTT